MYHIFATRSINHPRRLSRQAEENIRPLVELRLQQKSLESKVKWVILEKNMAEQHKLVEVPVNVTTMIEQLELIALRDQSQIKNIILINDELAAKRLSVVLHSAYNLA